jgi:type IV pilus assembly protein PilA
MTKNLQKGFTLIELMIVVAIIGILAAIAIPAYQDYTIRSQVTEGLTLAGAVKASVAESYANTGEWPADLDAAVGLSAGGGAATIPAGKYVAAITVTDGTITIQYGNDVNSTIDLKYLSLTPKVSQNNDVIWLCGNFTAVDAVAAGEINDPVAGPPAGANQTDLDEKYMPSNCRTDA